jgi:hypothetical protein
VSQKAPLIICAYVKVRLIEMQYIIIIIIIIITLNQRSEAEMKWRDIKSKGQDLIIVLQKDLVENGMVMLEHFQGTWRCIQQLNEIALLRTTFLTSRVFDLLYDAEQILKELGFKEGMESMKN